MTLHRVGRWIAFALSVALAVVLGIERDLLAAEELSSAKLDAASPVRSGDVVTMQIFDEYVLRHGKISSADVQAAIQLVASRGAGNQAFVERVISELEQSDNLYVQRNLIKVMTKILAKGGGARWQTERAARIGELGQAASGAYPIGDSQKAIVMRMIELGRKATRSNIDDFVLAIRQAHHPIAERFLLDVLKNPETSDLKVGKWADNIGGSWSDAKFHSAVALAELGHSDGVEWLISKTDGRFGDGGYLNRAPHRGPQVKSLRECCLHALSDLSGEPSTLSQAHWLQWWKDHRNGFVPTRPVSLQIE